jgi:hypothetical protein
MELCKRGKMIHKIVMLHWAYQGFIQYCFH